LTHSFAGFFKKWEVALLALLKPLGFWGVGAMAILDSSSVPIPMDLILGGYVWADRHHIWIYCLMGALGSAIGGLVPFYLGRAGGEIFLLNRIDRAKYERMRNRFERQEFLAMMIPSMLPPPTPWKAFVFAAGVFEMRVLPFMLAVFVGRIVRWGVLSLLVVRYGPEIGDVIRAGFHQHMVPVLCSLGLLLALLLLVVLRKGFRKGTVQ
jgi:membrane protein YqaA with SNARE-associated domain